MKAKLIFNPAGDDRKEARQILGGNTTNLANLEDVKYPWAVELSKKMLDNFWRPEKAEMGSDVTTYPKLTDDEREAYKGILSFLIVLDSIQTANLPHIADYITAPEVAHALCFQQFQEGLHSYSYQYMIESIIEPAQRQEVYDYWRTDPVLLKRNAYISELYQQFLDHSCQENFYSVLIANYLLESLYFYNGFNFFYLLESRELMTGSADIIRWINRDELTHTVLFERIIKEVLPDDFHEATYKMFEEAVQQEIEWGQHILGDKVLGMNKVSIRDYTYHRGNNGLMRLGLKRIFPENGNPFKHLEALADVKDDNSTKGNYFERTLTSYNMADGLKGWEDI